MRTVPEPDDVGPRVRRWQRVVAQTANCFSNMQWEILQYNSQGPYENPPTWSSSLVLRPACPGTSSTWLERLAAEPLLQLYELRRRGGLA